MKEQDFLGLESSLCIIIARPNNDDEYQDVFELVEDRIKTNSHLISNNAFKIME